jgi:uncharacterized protein (DUF697 family)
MPSRLTAYEPEWETFEAEAPEWLGASGYRTRGETAELELAAELLAVTDEQELDQFLGNLIRQVGRKLGSIVRSPLGGAVGRALKGVIGKALPLAGGALGTFVGGPLGASIGSSLASMAGQALGLELEGLSPEDRELEAAKRFVRFASEAVQNALSAPPSNDPAAAAQAALVMAARNTAPGLLPFAIPAAANANEPARALRRRARRRRRRPVANIYTRPAEDTMHDIDRAQLEADFENDYEADYEADLEGDYEADYEADLESDYEADLESDYEADYEADLESENHESEWAGETEAVLNEADEMEFASQLMEVNDEQELDQFLGALIRKAGRALGSFVRSPEGHAIGGILKGAVRQMMPHAATGLGTLVGGPLGAQISSGLASLASNELGMESETPDQESQQYEGAKQFVRVAADTVRNTLAAGPYAEPTAAAQAAIVQAANTRAPGLLQSVAPDDGSMSGRWMRRSGKIVLYGV